MPNLLYIFELVVAVGLIVFVHELGHFMAAKAFNVHVRKFALGLGPVIVRYTRGETEYSLRCIPLGGFVDLVGEHPEATEAEDPRGLWRKPAWQKIVVFSAGVCMNAVLAVILFTLSPIVGMQYTPPVVGGVSPGFPAQKAGMLPGDQLISINGNPIKAFEDVLYNVLLADEGTDFEVRVERETPAGPVQKLTFNMESTRVDGFPGPLLGIEPERSTIIAAIDKPDDPARQVGLQVGDRILSVNDQPVANWRALDKALADAKPGVVTLVVHRGEKDETLKADPATLKAFDDGFAPITTIDRVNPASPAEKAGLMKGDVLLAVQDAPWPSAKTASDIIKNAAGKELTVKVKRGDQTLIIPVTPAMTPNVPRPIIGIQMGTDMKGPAEIGEVDPKGAAAEADIRTGDVIVSVAGQAVKSWEQAIKALEKAGGKATSLKLRRADDTVTVTLKPKPVVLDHMVLVSIDFDAMFLPLPRIYNPLEAAERGVVQTYRWFARTYITLKQMMTKQVDTGTVAGPVFIGKAAYSVASRGLGTLLDFTAIITVSIAVLNFLPFPPFDGGHVLFTLMESVRRKPISMKIRTVAWIIGWALVLAVFVAVTFRDIFYR